MNVGELLRERDRLLDVMAEAKIAKSRIKQLNVLIAMYGDDEKVPVVVREPGKDTLGRRITRSTGGVTICPQCPGLTFKGNAGLSMHNHRVHTGKTLAPHQKAPKGAKLRRVS